MPFDPCVGDSIAATSTSAQGRGTTLSPTRSESAMSSARPQFTDFSIDIQGRYVCNGLDEALHSMSKSGARPDRSPQDDARPFDVLVLGGGSFGGVFAHHHLREDETNSHRVLVLEAGRLSLLEHFQNLPLQTEPTEVWGLP